MFYFALLALVAGMAIALQASMNARLGVLLNDAILATAIAFFSAFLVILMSLSLINTSLPQLSQLRNIPPYLWLGGVLSAFGVGAFYFLIPKMGLGAMMSFALTGQLLISIVANHFGWFNHPVRTITIETIFGILAMIAGVFLINWGTVDAH